MLISPSADESIPERYSVAVNVHSAWVLKRLSVDTLFNNHNFLPAKP